MKTFQNRPYVRVIVEILSFKSGENMKLMI